MAYVVSLKQFEGPLDLLLHLITKAKVDIRDISVSYTHLDVYKRQHEL